jgi:phenylacetate-coenzyme A ligase PaaK-like adenylate-forming protein
MSLSDFREILKKTALLHLESREAVIASRKKNFRQAISRLTHHQRKWYFEDHTIDSLDDLSKGRMLSPDDLEKIQKQHPPYGIFEPGEILVQNSGSTTVKKQFPFNLDSWYRYVTPAARGLLHANVGPEDRVLTTDIGSTQAGYRTPEEAATWICGSQVIYDRSASLIRKLEHMRDFNITVLISNWKKLSRMAELGPTKWFSHPLKLIVNTGMPLLDPDYISRSFGGCQIMDFYGCAEMGNIYFSCTHGHRHVHEDHVHVIERDGKSLYNNLSSLPIWNYDLGDKFSYSFKGRCLCGSHLSTVDHFDTKTYDNIEKG